MESGKKSAIKKANPKEPNTAAQAASIKISDITQAFTASPMFLPIGS